MPSDRSLPGLPASLREAIKAGGIELVRVEQPDLHGISRSKLVPIRAFEELPGRTGLNFPLPPLALDVQCEAVAGSGYLAERGFPDTRLKPDLATFAPLPWVPATARVIADPYHAADGGAAAAGARHVARTQIARLAQAGFELLSGFETEFYVFDDETGIAADAQVRQFASFAARDHALVREILRGLAPLGLKVTTANLEYGPGQFEINFAPALGLAAADQAYTFKNAVKEIAAGEGRIASFITKPAIDRSASGSHFNQTLLRDGRNVLADTGAADGLTPLGRHFLAGQLAHAPALSALYAPTVNCAKRFRPNSFAPFRADWAVDDRSVALRVKTALGEPAHLENRLPTAASNPYLVLAGTIAAGLDGIRRRLEPPAPSRGGTTATDYAALPASLDAALDALEQDAAIRDALGQEFIQVFLAVKRHEIAKARRVIADFDQPDFLQRVDPWELAELLPVL
jgi:glutamine synthetase